MNKRKTQTDCTKKMFMHLVFFIPSFQLSLLAKKFYKDIVPEKVEDD